MPLDPQFRTVLDTFEATGLIPLVRGDAATTRAHCQQLAQARRGAEYGSRLGWYRLSDGAALAAGNLRHGPQHGGLGREAV